MSRTSPVAISTSIGFFDVLGAQKRETSRANRVTRVPRGHRAVLGLLAVCALQPAICAAQIGEISPEAVSEAVAAYERLRREDAGLPERTAEAIAEDIKAMVRDIRNRAGDMKSVTARSAEGSVAASARCLEGYVTGREHSASDQNVAVVSEDLRDCEAAGCRAYEVSAISERTEPFDLSVSVTCST